MMNKNESDLELALFLARHIDSPCEVDVEGQAYNIRDFYSREARRILPDIDNAIAREILIRKIDQYSSRLNSNL